MTLAPDVIKRLKWRRDIWKISNYHNDTPHNVMLSVTFFAVIFSMVITLSNVSLEVIGLGVVILSVVMLKVMAPWKLTETAFSNISSETTFQCINSTNIPFQSFNRLRWAFDHKVKPILFCSKTVEDDTQKEKLFSDKLFAMIVRIENKKKWRNFITNSKYAL
jgi:hypothetical protein